MEKVRSSTYLVVTNIRFLFGDDWSIVIWLQYQWAFFVLLNKMCTTMLGERIYLATGVWCSPTRVPSLEETTFMENACVALRCSLVKFLDTISYMIQNSALGGFTYQWENFKVIFLKSTLYFLVAFVFLITKI